jgi:signal transduction histidine kinase
MRSIRLSLIVSFLVLMAATLGGVSWFAYQTAYRTLEEKEASTRALIQTEYERRCRAAESQFDKDLQLRVYKLAGEARPKTQYTPGLPIHSLGALTAGLVPQGHLLIFAWAAEYPNGWTDKREPRDRDPKWNPNIFRAFGAQVSIEFPPNVVHWMKEAPPHEYCLTFSDKGNLLEHSPLPEVEPFVLVAPLSDAKLLQPYFDDIHPKNGVHMRRVTLRTTAQHERTVFQFQRWTPGPPPPFQGKGKGAGGRKGDKQPSPKEPRVVDRSNVPFYVQYILDTAELDTKLSKIAADRDEQFQEQGQESAAQLEALRDRLLWLGLIAFLATGAGGFAMLHFGLKPLQRLSDAVSRISERDFRLPLDGAPLPSELRPIEERLQQTLDLLKRAFAREKQAAADISHELRTPLAALMTTLEVALRKQRSPEEYREILQDCRDSGKHMTQLVERLLALARLDAGADLVRAREVDAAVLAEQCAAMVRPLAEAHGLALTVRHQGNARLKTDPDKLREVLNNLLHNAIQYNRPHGSIDLEVRRDNGSLELAVRDTGIGITAQAREHIFERFYRADPSRQADGLNAGLGLAIVKGYVDLLGGSIRVDSTEGQGSAFRVCLPAHAETATN